MSQSLFAQYQPLAAIATTPRGAQTLQPFCQASGATLWVPDTLRLDNTQRSAGSSSSSAAFRSEVSSELRTSCCFEQAQNYTSLKDCITHLWQQARAIIFCLATGAVVRLIGPLLQDKATDPAVVVLDPEGRFVISLCSAHQGKADRLARLVARQLGATPVLTGASASLELPGIDVLGDSYGWQRGEGDWTGVSAAIARGELVQVVQETGSTLWQEHLPTGHPFYFGFPEYNQTKQETIEPKARIWISPTQRRLSTESDLPKAQWYPRVLWVGIGCERGTSLNVISTAIDRACQRYHLASKAIAGIASIDLKADETALVQFCRDRHYPLLTFSAEVLRQVEVPNPSAVVEREVGTPSVAEAAALAAANHHQRSISQEFFSTGILLVPKQVFRLDGEPGAATVAIAKSELEYTGRIGQLLLVGTGPGSLEQMTPAAQTAITEADAVVGYSLYIELIASLRRPGQIVESLPITQEQQRAQRAIELAKWGLTVAVVSSGDCGIYGMAGLVLEQLQSQGWDGKSPGVQVFPGITALQAAAAKVGAPLMHDFCAISLSDLLTPWEVIEKRLEAAAAADFVTCLYNPRSNKRSQQIAIAQQIFLQYRHPDTPVAIVRSAYRQDEQIVLTSLQQMLEFPIDMLTTVLIGNHSTRNYANWLITPRGYLGFS